MSWRTVVVNAHSKLSFKNNHLYYRSAKQNEMIHLSEIGTLILETTDITITNMLLQKLADMNILVIFCDSKRLPKSMLMPYYGRHDSSLQIQKQINWTEGTKELVWMDIVEQKILNQATFLEIQGFEDKASSLIKLSEEVEFSDRTNREGHAARIYFNKLFGNDFTRSSITDINAGLDYGYTLILSMFAREICKSGCLTQIGIKHINQYNEFNLASDFMEPFRVLVDEIVYLNRGSEFKIIKRNLFDMFSNTYEYNQKNMYLSNIVSDYVKKVIQSLNGEKERMPVFRI
ncbi:type II CRISPR-associated endonuclease Cas1 [Aerococcaceae bacterium DSM 111176]|nr:type II CRISPR-associated endonuclease Cas1 [Aerococcaceae bacterium DSM 111176]